jgi:hypothetical protein
MKSLVLALAIAVVASAAQAQQLDPCTYYYVRHLGSAGDQRVARLARETRRRGGGAAAAGKLYNTSDYQSLLRSARRACPGRR